MKRWLLTCLFLFGWNLKVQGKPAQDESNQSGVPGGNIINRVGKLFDCRIIVNVWNYWIAGQQALDKFDHVFYGLVDEAMHHVTDDRKGAFKEMLLRHRNDLLKNFQDNLIKRENITLQDLRKVISREFQNRRELFNYVGSGLWNKINFYSSKLMNQYKDYCDRNPTNVFCFNGSERPKSNELEREEPEK